MITGTELLRLGAFGLAVFSIASIFLWRRV